MKIFMNRELKNVGDSDLPQYIMSFTEYAEKHNLRMHMEINTDTDGNSLSVNFYEKDLTRMEY